MFVFMPPPVAPDAAFGALKALRGMKLFPSPLRSP
jgi:hypothetical protein